MAHLRAGDQSLVGYKYICHMLDSFEHKGPNGTHVCLVLELMAESLRAFSVIFYRKEIPLPIMQRFTFQLLCALDYAHEHNVIHTGRILSHWTMSFLSLSADVSLVQISSHSTYT